MYYQAVGLLPKDQNEAPRGTVFKQAVNFEAKDFSQNSNLVPFIIDADNQSIAELGEE